MTSVSSSRPRAFRSVEQRGDRPVALLGVVAVVGDVGVVVPGLAVAVVDLRHAHAALDQPAGDQAGVGELALAVQLARRGRLAGRGRTPPAPRTACGRPSPATRSGPRAASSRPRASRCSRFSCWSRSSCSRCAAASRWRLVDVADDPFGVDRLVVDVRALVDARQEAVAPQLRADDRLAGAEDDEAGQVLVLGAQAVGQPRAQARAGSAACCPSSSSAATARGSGCRCASSGSRRCRRCSRRPAGYSSLTSMPLWPCFANVNGERHQLAAACCRPVLTDVGGRLAVVLRRAPAWGRTCRRATARRS